jgi:hypothetical protein
MCRSTNIKIFSGFLLEQRVRFERTTLAICSRLHWASLPPLHKTWSGVRESNPHSQFRRLLSYPLNERQYCLVGRVGFEPTRSFRNSIMSRGHPTNSASGPQNLGATGQNRTGMPCGGRFSYHYSFRYLFSLWSGLYLHHSLSLRCPPSSLYTFKDISI